MQLQTLSLSKNQLVGSLPETWSNLTNVSPTGVFKLTLCCVFMSSWSQGSKGITLSEVYKMPDDMVKLGSYSVPSDNDMFEPPLVPLSVN